MTGRVDSRDVLERLQDLVEAVDFELTHPEEPFERCACGATLLTWADGLGRFVCAGCGLTPTYWLDRIHPAPVLAQSFSGDWERGVPPELSAVRTLARKDAGALDVRAIPSGSGVLGRAGYALRSLKLGVNWGAIDAFLLVAMFWVLVLAVVV